MSYRDVLSYRDMQGQAPVLEAQSVVPLAALPSDAGRHHSDAGRLSLNGHFAEGGVLLRQRA